MLSLKDETLESICKSVLTFLSDLVVNGRRLRPSEKCILRREEAANSIFLVIPPRFFKLSDGDPRLFFQTYPSSLRRILNPLDPDFFTSLSQLSRKNDNFVATEISKFFGNDDAISSQTTTSLSTL